MSQKPAMIECPKCGFHQPPDRYCANCGIDMENFKPKSSLWRNAYFQFAIAAIAVICSLFILRDKANDRDDQGAFIESEIEESFASGDNFAPPTSPPPRPVSKRKAPRPQKRNQVQRAKSSPTIGGTALNKTPEVKKNAPPRLRVTFAEVLQNSRTISDFDRIIPGFKKLLGEERNSSIKVLAQSSLHPLVPDQTFSVFEGFKDEELDRDIGFTIQVTASVSDAKTAEFQVEVLRVLKEYDGDIAIAVEQPFQENFRLVGQEAAMMREMLSYPQNLSEEDSNFFSGTVFRVYSSEAFQEGLSDFALFFEVTRD